MQKYKKFMMFLLAGCMLFSTTACGGGSGLIDSVEKVDKEKTQLYVGVYDGAIGYEWMNEYKKMYEAENPDVQIMIDPKKADYDAVLSTKMPSNRQDIYFLSHNSYNEFVTAGVLEEITDTITEKIYDADMNMAADGAGVKSILDSMDKNFDPVYNVNGHYYAIPNFYSPAGIYYDANVFEENGYEVPTTYTELIALMDRMVVDNYIPFTFSNMLYIVSNALTGVWASYEGASNFNLNNTFTGTDSVLGNITTETGYLLQQQQGKKAALQFAYDLMSKNAYTTSKARAGLGHEGAQQEFVGSIKTENDGGKRICMFLESSYWEPEVKEYMKSLGTLNSEWGYGQRNFKFMPFPSFDNVAGIANQTNDKTTLYGANARSMVCINKASDQKDLAKDFLQFVQQRKCLALFTQYSSSFRPYDYEATPEEVAKYTTMGQDLYNIVKDSNTEIMYHIDACRIKQLQNTEWFHDWSFMTSCSVTSNNPITAFYTNTKLTVDEYFNGLGGYWTQSRWGALL